MRTAILPFLALALTEASREGLEEGRGCQSGVSLGPPPARARQPAEGFAIPKWMQEGHELEAARLQEGLAELKHQVELAEAQDGDWDGGPGEGGGPGCAVSLVPDPGPGSWLSQCME
jgi:hypothetical protein